MYHVAREHEIPQVLLQHMRMQRGQNGSQVTDCVMGCTGLLPTIDGLKLSIRRLSMRSVAAQSQATGSQQRGAVPDIRTNRCEPKPFELH